MRMQQLPDILFTACTVGARGQSRNPAAHAPMQIVMGVCGAHAHPGDSDVRQEIIQLAFSFDPSLCFMITSWVEVAGSKDSGTGQIHLDVRHCRAILLCPYE